MVLRTFAILSIQAISFNILKSNQNEVQCQARQVKPIIRWTFAKQETLTVENSLESTHNSDLTLLEDILAMAYKPRPRKLYTLVIPIDLSRELISLGHKKRGFGLGKCSYLPIPVPLTSKISYSSPSNAKL